jgi:hypothetical protein
MLQNLEGICFLITISTLSWLWPENTEILEAKARSKVNQSIFLNDHARGLTE